MRNSYPQDISGHLNQRAPTTSRGGVIDVAKKVTSAPESNGHATWGRDVANHHGANLKSRDDSVVNAAEFQGFFRTRF